LKTVVIIPARFASTRFPGKPLADLNGKPMVMHAYDALSPYYDTYIATDHIDIALTAFERGANVIYKSEYFSDGTQRIAGSLDLLSYEPDYVINVQGDEPLVSHLDVEVLERKIQEDGVKIATLATRVSADTKNIVRVVTDGDQCIEFSRCNCMKEKTDFRHLGMYAFEYDTLVEIGKLQNAENQIPRSLEQVKWMDNGYKIHFSEVDVESVGVDSPEDLEYVRQILNKNAS